ncbi:MAG: hypothetical protein CEO40_116 [Parcubacteria group bacterium LiPW_72]|nr:MAG: hypothetical protein CEO40_116 [Parcubacteria group bacterium LiPW_72]
MPNKIERKDSRPRHLEVFQIPINPRIEKKADWVGINRGKQVIGFFTAVEQESITPGVRTNTGWKYYPIPKGAYYVLFNVTPDDHPKIRDKIIKIAEFRDQNKQKIETSRVETK